MKPGDRIKILETNYCGIDFARVGDFATITHKGPTPSAFWVTFDCKPELPCLILIEHSGVGWQFSKGETARAC